MSLEIRFVPIKLKEAVLKPPLKEKKKAKLDHKQFKTYRLVFNESFLSTVFENVVAF